MDDDLIKSRSHRYVKRTGSPGNYKYWYKLPDGTLAASDDMQHGGKVDHAKRLLAGHGVHHTMSTQDIAAHTGLDHDKVSSAKRNLARAGTTWQGRTFAEHGYNEHHMKEAKHSDTTAPEYHAHASASNGESHHITEPAREEPAAEAPAPARTRRPRAPRAAPAAPASEDHHHVDHADETPATPEAIERMRGASSEEASRRAEPEASERFSAREVRHLSNNDFTESPDPSGLHVYTRENLGYTYDIIKDEDGKTRLNIRRGSTPLYSGSRETLDSALDEAIRDMNTRRARKRGKPLVIGSEPPESPEAPATPAAPVNDNAARIAKLRAKLASEHGISLGAKPEPEGSTAERAAKAAAIARASSPTSPAAAAVHEVSPDLAAADEPIRRIEEVASSGGNPYISRAAEIFHNIQGDVKPERAEVAKYMFQTLEHLGNTSQPLNEENVLREYKRLSGKRVRGLSGVAEEFEKATFTTLEEVMGNQPVNAEVERMKRGYGAKQFARMKPFIKQSWHDANPSAPPPYPTFGDVKSWGEHGGPKPSWAGNTRLAMPQDVFDAAHKGEDGKPKYPPAWMPIHMMPAWNYVMKKSGDDTPYEARNVNFGQNGKLNLGSQATHQEGMVIASLRKYVQMRGGPEELTDIPGSKLSEVGLTHSDIFKGMDPNDLSDKTLKKILKSKIVDPIALAPFIDEELKAGKKEPIKKSFSLVINSALPKASFSEDLLKSELIRKIKKLRGMA